MVARSPERWESHAAHLAAGLNPGSRRRAAWQYDDWRSQIRAVSRDLADLFAPGTAHSCVLEICRILRNTVHGEALHTTAVQQGGKPLRTLVALPEDDAEDLANERSRCLHQPSAVRCAAYGGSCL
jgi:hypothetical protein